MAATGTGETPLVVTRRVPDAVGSTTLSASCTEPALRPTVPLPGIAMRNGWVRSTRGPPRLSNSRVAMTGRTDAGSAVGRTDAVTARPAPAALTARIDTFGADPLTSGPIHLDSLVAATVM